MSELVGWLIVVGLAAAIACIFMLSSQLEQHMRNTTEMMVRSNQMILAQLERLENQSPQPSQPAVGVVLERRHAQRRDSLGWIMGRSGATKRSDLPRRRLDDLLST